MATHDSTINIVKELLSDDNAGMTKSGITVITPETLTTLINEFLYDSLKGNKESLVLRYPSIVADIKPELQASLARLPGIYDSEAQQVLHENHDNLYETIVVERAFDGSRVEVASPVATVPEIITSEYFLGLDNVRKGLSLFSAEKVKEKAIQGKLPIWYTQRKLIEEIITMLVRRYSAESLFLGSDQSSLSYAVKKYLDPESSLAVACMELNSDEENALIESSFSSVVESLTRFMSQEQWHAYTVTYKGDYIIITQGDRDIRDFFFHQVFSNYFQR